MLTHIIASYFSSYSFIYGATQESLVVPASEALLTRAASLSLQLSDSYFRHCSTLSSPASHHLSHITYTV